MSNVKLFDIRNSTDECQNDLKVKVFDIQHLNDKMPKGSECSTLE